MKKHILAVILLIFFVLESTCVQAAATPVLQSGSAALIDQSTGNVLFEKNADKRVYPASTTKVLTAIIAVENLKLDDNIQVGDEIKKINSDASDAGLYKGEKLSARDLLYALMLPSGDDAAYTIAVQVARKKSGKSSMSINDAVKYFANLMNKKAKKIGAKHSNFVNPDGYHNYNHYSTAMDIAIIAREALKNDFLCKVVRTEKYKARDLNSDKTVEWYNTNELLNKKSKYYYSYATGLKTGYTSQAGYCLVSSAVKENSSVIAVTMNSIKEDGRWTDSKTILEYGLNNINTIKPIKTNYGKNTFIDYLILVKNKLFNLRCLGFVSGIFFAFVLFRIIVLRRRVIRRRKMRRLRKQRMLYHDNNIRR